MVDYNEVKGDLIKLAQNGDFDVIAHGCNCFCAMGAGIAPQMADAFGCDNFPLEDIKYSGDKNKLGMIDYKTLTINDKDLTVVNAYTQYGFGGNPFDYDAFIMIVSQMNTLFKGKHIGLPKIGAGLAGGHWPSIKQIIIDGFTDCKVTVVNYSKWAK
jgi:O-acetyl-ADP-ribose deacetylase (regulator of RNase III)